MRGLRATVAAASAAAWLIPAPADADNKRLRTEAERRNRLANGMYTKGRFEEALQMYQSAYDLRPSPKYLFNIGLAKEKTFDYEGCAVAFRSFLSDTDDDDMAKAREDAQRRLDACIERTKIPVRITSFPTNAAIRLTEDDDSRLLGRTPNELSLAPGSYQITVEAPGYVSQTRSIVVEIGQRSQTDFVLEKLSTLRIEVDPAGARVKLDDEPWAPAPVSREVRAGAHEVVVEKEGYETARRQLRVDAGEGVSLVLPLRPLPKLSKVSVSLDARLASTAALEIDGRSVGALPIERALAPGPHRVRVSAPGHVPFADDIQVPDARDLSITVALEPTWNRRDKIVVWSLVGATGAAATTGTVFGVMTLLDKRSFDDDPTLDRQDTGRSHARIADASFVTAAVFGAAAVAYYFWARPGKSRARIDY